MTLHSEDYAQLWMPLAAELVRAVIGLIFGKEETKNRIAQRYKKGGSNEMDYSADHFNTGGGFRW